MDSRMTLRQLFPRAKEKWRLAKEDDIYDTITDSLANNINKPYQQ